MQQRKIEQIIAQIDAQIQSSIVLSVLTVNPSATAIWQWIRYAIAYSIWFFEGMVVSHAGELENFREKDAIGKDLWYAKQMKLFQYGDALEWDDEGSVLRYPIVDISKRIIVSAAVSAANGIAIVKVAKSVSGELAPLDASEKAAATAYLDRIQIAGTNMVLQSYPPDAVTFGVEVWHDAQIDFISLIEPQVQSAISNYLRNLDFNGIIIWTLLIDSLQKITGVKAVKINNASVSVNGGTQFQINEWYQTVAGYAVQDTNFPSIIISHPI